MKSDDLEQRIQRQALRPIPLSWREPILASARQACGLPRPARITSSAPPWRTVLSTLNSQLSAVLCPSPKAWAGLAAVWIGILGVHLATRDAAPVFTARQAAPPSAQLLQALAEQKRLLSRLTWPCEMPAEVPPRPSLPRPRSEARQDALLT